MDNVCTPVEYGELTYTQLHVGVPCSVGPPGVLEVGRQPRGAKATTVGGVEHRGHPADLALPVEHRGHPADLALPKGVFHLLVHCDPLPHGVNFVRLLLNAQPQCLLAFPRNACGVGEGPETVVHEAGLVGWAAGQEPHV